MTQFKGRGLVQLTGRQSGKSMLQQMYILPKRQRPKIIWHHLPGRKLKATWEVQPRGMEAGYGLNEDDMLPIQEWVEANLKGSKRISFDTWLFKSDKHVTMFLLRWS